VPIVIARDLLAGADAALLADELWALADGRCALCAGRLDRDDDLEAGRAPDGALRLVHTRCEHDPIDAIDRERLAVPAEARGGDGSSALAGERRWRHGCGRVADSALPLLMVGAERTWEWRVAGPLGDGTEVVLGCLRCTFGGDGGPDEEGMVLADVDDSVWTVALVTADLAGLGFLTLTRADEVDDLQVGFDRRRLDLESAAFAERLRLAIAEGADEQCARLAFTPVLQVALGARGLAEDTRWEAADDGALAARSGSSEPDDLPELIDLLGDALWLRAVLAGDPPGRLPDRAALRALALGDAWAARLAR